MYSLEIIIIIFLVHNAVVTAAIFAPNPSSLRPNSKRKSTVDSQEDEGEVMITADFTGALKVVRNLKWTIHHKTEEKSWQRSLLGYC